jgi:outer membrane protein, heavy metal efflux system
MRFERRTLTLVLAVCLCPPVASAQTVLTLPDALARAREHAPEIVGARLAVAEARARVTGAVVRPSNPELDVSVGNRDTPTGRSTDLQVGATQALEAPGRRAARLAGATAQVDQSLASAEDVAREVLREVATTFFQAVYATERVRLLRTAEDLANTVLQAADRRYRAGDIPVLDFNLARASLARARSDREAGEAELAAALGTLRRLLLLDSAVAVQGTFAVGEAPDPGPLFASAQQRPELRRLEAAVREAEADAQLGRTLGRPDYGVGLRYEQEGDDRILLGGLTVSLPVFSKGQELRATGAARAARLRAELEAAKSRVRIDLEVALDTHKRRMAAARALSSDALPELDENEALAARSFEVGQIGLSDVLVIRREILETRSAYLSALLEAALARVAVDHAAAVLR